MQHVADLDQRDRQPDVRKHKRSAAEREVHSSGAGDDGDRGDGREAEAQEPEEGSARDRRGFPDLADVEGRDAEEAGGEYAGDVSGLQVVEVGQDLHAGPTATYIPGRLGFIGEVAVDGVG